MSFDKDSNGEVYILRSGRLVVSSQQPSGGSYLLIKDATVSNMHAIIRVTDSGEIQVLDQLSEAGTIIKRFGSGEVVNLSGDKTSVDHGDIVSFGDRKFHVCILARQEEQETEKAEVKGEG